MIKTERIKLIRDVAGYLSYGCIGLLVYELFKMRGV